MLRPRCRMTALRNVGPETGAIAHPLAAIPTYALGNLAFWCALALLIVTATARRRSPPTREP